MITLNHDTHIYTTDTGERLISVTQVLNQCGFMDGLKFVDGRYLDYTSGLGTEIHRVCYLYDTDNLVMDSIDPIVKPYLSAWIEFCEDYNFKSKENELIVSSKKYSFAGTLDKLGFLSGKLSIIDIKSGSSIQNHVALQTAAYLIACNEQYKSTKKVRRRFTVRLLSDATYRVQEYKDRGDLTAFLSCISFLNTKRRYS